VQVVWLLRQRCLDICGRWCRVLCVSLHATHEQMLWVFCSCCCLRGSDPAAAGCWGCSDGKACRAAACFGVGFGWWCLALELVLCSRAWLAGRLDRWGLEVSIVISAVPAMCSVYVQAEASLGRGIAGLQGSGVFETGTAAAGAAAAAAAWGCHGYMVFGHKGPAGAWVQGRAREGFCGCCKDRVL